MMKRLYFWQSIWVVGVATSLSVSVVAQPPVIPIDGVENPEVPTGNSRDIEGIEQNENQWNWGSNNGFSANESNSPYILAPESRSPQELTDEFQWNNIGEPENSGAKIPVGQF